MTLDIPKPNNNDGDNVGGGRGDSYSLPPPPSKISRHGVSHHYPNSVSDDLSGFTMILQEPQAKHHTIQPSATQDIFISSMRKAVLSQDVIHNSNRRSDVDSSADTAATVSAFTEHRIHPVVLRDDFVVKACNFMEMCQGRAQKSRRGHIKIDQAFRSKGTFVEGWIFVRWMEVGWSSAGFKPHKLGSLPLVMFPRKATTDCDETSDLQDTLDKVMHEIYPILVECFPECDIVPVQSCQELWKPAQTTREGSELKAALERAAEKGSNSFTMQSESNSSLEVPPIFEPTCTGTMTNTGTSEECDDDVDLEAAGCVTAEDTISTCSQSGPTKTWQVVQCKITPFGCFATVWALCIWAAILFIICWVLSR